MVCIFCWKRYMEEDSGYDTTQDDFDNHPFAENDCYI